MWCISPPKYTLSQVFLSMFSLTHFHFYHLCHWALSPPWFSPSFHHHHHHHHCFCCHFLLILCHSHHFKIADLQSQPTICLGKSFDKTLFLLSIPSMTRMLSAALSGALTASLTEHSMNSHMVVSSKPAALEVELFPLPMATTSMSSLTLSFARTPLESTSGLSSVGPTLDPLAERPTSLLLTVLWWQGSTGAPSVNLVRIHFL